MRMDFYRLVKALTIIYFLIFCYFIIYVGDCIVVKHLREYYLYKKCTHKSHQGGKEIKNVALH